MNKIELKNWVEKNPKLVKMRESVNYPGLFVLKYTNRVFYDGLWNRFLEECRGTVIDKDFNIVSRPFTKVYNYGIEKQAPKLDNDVVVDAWRKVNGFMASVTWHDGDILVSTTGSLDSDFCAMARELIDVERYRTVCRGNPQYTFMFECVHRNDPHIIPEQEGMYLLGYRKKDWDSKIVMDYKVLEAMSVQFGTLPVEYFCTTVGDLLKVVKNVKHEGFVFYTEDGVGSKIKSPYYLTSKWVARNPRTDKLMRDDIKQSIDEEYYPLIDKIRANIVEYTEMDEQTRLAWVREALDVA
jgi:hypothetical protein